MARTWGRPSSRTTSVRWSTDLRGTAELPEGSVVSGEQLTTEPGPAGSGPAPGLRRGVPPPRVAPGCAGEMIARGRVSAQVAGAKRFAVPGRGVTGYGRSHSCCRVLGAGGGGSPEPSASTGSRRWSCGARRRGFTGSACDAGSHGRLRRISMTQQLRCVQCNGDMRDLRPMFPRSHSAFGDAADDPPRAVASRCPALGPQSRGSSPVTVRCSATCCGVRCVCCEEDSSRSNASAAADLVALHQDALGLADDVAEGRCDAQVLLHAAGVDGQLLVTSVAVLSVAAWRQGPSPIQTGPRSTRFTSSSLAAAVRAPRRSHPGSVSHPCASG
ncbi:hypothetical protein SAMN05443575_0629 [Jatrophihabitans endophyticus]|uniref:Uncharacterized protein n=1 Tax=Jatrophihabitans endophyticus TaxID=1206085 RepID=A0A1M5DMC4_9ACTN|nr:hypothetical protein SAMN05443575_0629 [Jatrophihabitans endophyticus]